MNLFGNLDKVNTSLEETKKSVSDGKSSIASAITDNGVATAADATFAAMKSNINTACANKYTAGHSAGYSSGVTDADNRVNTGSTNYKGGYNQGVTDADSRANVNSTNYKTGYSNGVTYADGRANSDSTNYKAGYNTGHSTGYSNGVSDADGRANPDSTNYKTGYNSGYEDGKKAASGYKVHQGQFVYSNSSSGWKSITIDTGLKTVVGYQVHGHYKDNAYYGMGGLGNDGTIARGKITLNVSFIAGCDHTIYWLAYGDE